MNSKLADFVKFYLALCTLINYTQVTILALLPPEVTYLCPGGLLNLTCSTNETTLRWNVTDPFDHRSETRSVTVFDSFEQVLMIRIRSSTLNITRSRPGDNSSRLVSMMTSENVSSDINGTIIRCAGYVTKVHIIPADGSLSLVPRLLPVLQCCNIEKLGGAWDETR